MPLQGPTTPGRRKEGPSAAASWSRVLGALLERETSRFFAWEPPESTNGGAAEGGKMPLGLPLGALVLLLFHPARQEEGQVK
ncbi:hypothetical protein E2320_007270, partial [Naja naja]